MSGGTNTNTKIYYRDRNGNLIKVGEKPTEKVVKILENQKRGDLLDNMRNMRRKPETPREKTFRDKVNEAKTKKELLGTLREKYGNSNVKPAFVNSNDIDMVKRVVNTVEDLGEKYPASSGIVTGFGVTKRRGVMACMSQTFNKIRGLTENRMDLGDGYWDIKDHPALLSDMGGFHPKNSTPESTIVHEYAHAIQGVLMSRMLTNAKNSFEKMVIVSKIQNGTALDFLEDRALQSLGINPSNRFERSETRGKISGYAKNPMGGSAILESFSEAFADVYANGDKANEVSKAYVKALMDELNNGG